MKHSTAARRAAVYLAGTALTGSALVAGAGAASAAPEDPDVTGVVTNPAGAPVAGVGVFAFTVDANGFAARQVDSARTGADGRYSLTDLDAASLAAPFAGQTQFKLFFQGATFPSFSAGARPVGYLDTYLGGAKAAPASAPVAIPAGATAPVTANQSLTTAGGIAATIVGPAGAPVTQGALTAIDASVTELTPFTESSFGSTQNDDDAYDNPATEDVVEPAPLDGVAIIGNLDPSVPVKLVGSGSSFDPVTGVGTVFGARFFGGGTSLEKAPAVNPTPGGYTPVTIALSSTLTNTEAPRILGDAAYGKTLTADPGVWVGSSGDITYAYQWLRGSTPVATTATYKVSKADKGKKIKLVVTAYQDDANLLGQVATKPTSKAGEKSRLQVKKVKGGLAYAVTVKSKKKLGTVTGKVVIVTEDGTEASKKVKLKAGKATVTLKKKFLGTKPLTVSYLGAKKIGPGSKTIGGGKKK